MIKTTDIKGVYCDFADNKSIAVQDDIVIKVPSSNSNCTQSITASIDDEYITLSDTEYGCQYVTIPLDKWQELKELIDSQLE